MSNLILTRSVTPTPPAALKQSYFSDANDGGRTKTVDSNGTVYTLSRAQAQNYLLNVGLRFAQRQAPGTLTTYNSATARLYTADRWAIVNQAASLQYQRIDALAAVEANLFARYYGKLKQITGAGKFALFQPVSSDDVGPLRGQTVVRFQLKMRYSVAAAMNVRLGCLYLTASGTADTLPNPVASAFNANGTDPTWGANLVALAPTNPDGGTVNGLGLDCVLTGGWARYSATFSIPTTAKNVIPIIWSNSQLAINDEFNWTEAGFYVGPDLIDWVPISIADEITEVQRFFWKTFAVDVAPVQNAGLTTGPYRSELILAGATALAAEGYIRHPVPMLKAPTVILFNPAAANGQARQISGTAGDLTATTATNVTDTSLDITATGIATGVVGAQWGIHLGCEAEI